MPKILIDILPATGHFHATLKIATILKNEGYEVVYGSHGYLQNEIQKYGFQFVPLPPLNVVKVNFRLRLSKIHRIATFFFWFLSQEKLVKSMGDAKKFQEAIKKIDPDLVLMDEQEALKALFYGTKGNRVVAFQTKPDTRRIKGIPPFTSFYLPKGFMAKTISSLLWNSKLFSYRFSYHLNSLITVKQDNFSTLKKMDKKLELGLKEKVDICRSFGIGIRNIPRVIISPAEFDFPHAEKENVFRVGPLVDVRRGGKIDQPRYQSLLNRINEAKEKNDFVVYCSLGTITSNFTKEVNRFFKKIGDVARKNPDFLFILSTGKDFDVSNLIPSPQNMYIYNYVPQAELLRYCDVMITHGGMNSITECIYNGVPMLVYPLSPRWDQPGNSARVKFHGLGLRGKLKRDSAKTISKKLNKIRSDHKVFTGDVGKMRSKFEKNNNSNQIVDIINKMLINNPEDEQN